MRDETLVDLAADLVAFLDSDVFSAILIALGIFLMGWTFQKFKKFGRRLQRWMNE